MNKREQERKAKNERRRALDAAGLCVECGEQPRTRNMDGSHVLDVRGDYQLPLYYLDRRNELTDHQFTLEGYKIINEIELTEHGQMMVSEVEIDVTFKTVTVS